MTTRGDRVFFPGLNGVRAVAALAVLLDHLELFKGYLGCRTLWSEETSAHLGAVGVTVFFVLSGFLITYLLLEEKARTGNIAVGRFYARRVLRIWPVYYLVVALSFFVIPLVPALSIPGYSAPMDDRFWTRFALFVGFLPNVAFVWLPTVPYGNVLWSVGVEEQFYLVWPLAHRGRVAPVWIVLGGLTAYLAIRIWTAACASSLGPEVGALVQRSRFSCMMIGALGAVLLRSRNSRVLRVAYHPAVQVLAGCLLVVMVGRWVAFRYYSLVQHEAIGVCAGVLILNVASNPRALVKLTAPALDWLGTVSYGFYVYHAMVVAVVLRVALPWYREDGWGYVVWSAAVLGGSVVCSAALAWASFRLVERPALRFKERFAAVASGPPTRGA